MSGFVEVTQILIIPGLISFAIFLSINYLVRPAIRRYRERYEQYLPIHQISGSISQRTSSLKSRIGDKIMAFILPRFQTVEEADNPEELYENDEVAGLAGFDIREVERRREQLRREVGDMEQSRRSVEDYGEVR